MKELDKKKLRHKYDKLLTVIAEVFGLLLFIFLSYASVFARENEELQKTLSYLSGIPVDTLKPILNIGGDIAIIVIAYLIYKIVQLNKSFLGKCTSTGMRISDSRFHQLEAEYLKYTELLGLKKVPKLFIVNETYKSTLLDVSIRSSSAICIRKSLLLEAEKTGNWDKVVLIVCRRLAAIYLGYSSLWYQVLSFPSRTIPKFKELLSRAHVYSIDNVCMALMGEESAFEQVFRENYDTELYRDMSTEEIVHSKIRNDSREEASSKRKENMSSMIPIAPYRLEAMLSMDAQGRLF